MKKMEAYRIATQHDNDAAFVANVIINHHGNAAKKLKGLVKLLIAGSTVRTGQYSIDTLVVNGERQDWTLLETA